MTTPTPPALDCPTHTPDRPHSAPQPVDTVAVGEPKGAARKGVVSALRSDPHRDDGRRPVAWLHITAPRGAIPTATSTCACGRDRSAIGKPRVLALIDDHTAHRNTCPLRSSQEGRAAA
ncbi:hypothetical protein [Streptomyces sp. NPDC058741]|uniref:hypothetical protein n=1 Tax=Streptomyces sp. NPDC058741 TaxID=3346620 RepID=UPI0036BCFC2C